MRPIAESTQSVDIFFFKEILGLLETIEKYVVPEKRQEFRHQAKFDLSNLNIALVDTLSKVTGAYTDQGLADFNEEWRQLRTRIETLKRRIQLLSPRTQQDFEAALMWLAERGVEKDLDLLQDVKKAPPYSSENIERLLEIAEQRIRVRLTVYEKQVLEALSKPKWDFRTIPGISRETKLSESIIRAILDRHPDKVRKSLVRDQEGHELFTLRSRRIKIRERLAEIRMFLAMPFD